MVLHMDLGGKTHARSGAGKEPTVDRECCTFSSSKLQTQPDKPKSRGNTDEKKMKKARKTGGEESAEGGALPNRRWARKGFGRFTGKEGK